MKVQISAHSHRPAIGGEVCGHLEDVRPLQEGEQGVDVGVGPVERVGHVAAVLQPVRLGWQLDCVHCGLLYLRPGQTLSSFEDLTLE